MKLHFFDIQNFGDALNKYILPAYQIPVTHAQPSEAQAVGIGSILSDVPSSFSGLILGTGFMFARNARKYPSASLVCLRGRLTAERCGASRKAILGDPGLLCGKLLEDKPPKKYVMGIIPHYVDSKNPKIQTFSDRYPDHVTVIDIRAPVLEVIHRIAECENIASSALHGLIAADALGIPNQWLVLSERVAGKGFKFKDYWSAFGVAQDPVTDFDTLPKLRSRCQYLGNVVRERIHQLDELFLTIKDTADPYP